MFERFTDKARKVVILAKTKATDQGDGQIGPVHMLYGLAASDGVAARALAGLGVDAAAVEREIGRGGSGGSAAGGASPGPLPPARCARPMRGPVTPRPWRRSASTWTRSSGGSRRASAPERLNAYRSPPRGPLNWTGRLPMNDQAKMSLALALKEARGLHHNYIGTEHLLLGLLRVAERDPRGSFAAVTLPALGLDPARVRARVLDELRQLQALTGAGSAGEQLAEGGRDIAVAADRPDPAAAQAGQVVGQVGILLAGGVEQDIQPRQPRGERAGVGTGVVNAVGQQQDPGVPGGHAGQLAPCDLERERDVGQAPGRDAQHRVEQPARRHPPPEVGEDRGVGPEGHHRQVVAGQLAGQGAHRGRGGADPLASHGPGDVRQQHDRAAGPDLLPHDDVLVLGHRVLGQLLDRPVEVDVV